MKSFKEFIVEEQCKKTHYGTCVDSFSGSTGNRKSSKGNIPYRDASDFAQQTTDDDNNNKPEHKVSKDDFLKHVKVDSKHEKILHHPDTEFLHNKERDSHIMYDAKKDVHHFYEHK